jgi:hypothetical protein
MQIRVSALPVEPTGSCLLSVDQQIARIAPVRGLLYCAVLCRQRLSSVQIPPKLQNTVYMFPRHFYVYRSRLEDPIRGSRSGFLACILRSNRDRRQSTMPEKIMQGDEYENEQVEVE